MTTHSYASEILRRTLPWGLLMGVAYAVYFVMNRGDVLLIPILLFVLGLTAAGARAAMSINNFPDDYADNDAR